MPQKTPLHEQHLSAGARMVDFAGWELPVHYGSQIDEHHAVRRDAGMFDVSHMTVVDVDGDGARAFLRSLLSNDVDRLRRPGEALYSCMLNEQAGIIDDLIVYRWDDSHYRIVSNAATRARVVAWIELQAEGQGASIRQRRDLAMIAVQGPQARAKTDACIPADWQPRIAPLGHFEAVAIGEWQMARTGYTGEDGYEVILPETEAARFWERLLTQGVRPCGLGARDTLRLEAGMRLYGSDMDEAVTPLEAGLDWTIAWQPEDRSFIGREVLAGQLRNHGRFSRFAGLVLRTQGVLRSHQRVAVPGVGEGVITSGGYSPTLGRGIALARLPPGTYSRCQVDIRGQWKEAQVVAPRFVRFGKSLVDE